MGMDLMGMIETESVLNLSAENGRGEPKENIEV